MSKKNIFPKNAEYQWHGYCEIYWNTGQLHWKGVYVNGDRYGYHEGYRYKKGSINEYWKGYYSSSIKISDNNKNGYCIIWNRVIV